MSGARSAAEIEMLNELSRLASGDDRELYVWRHPWLLEAGVAERLAATVGGERDAMAAALESVERPAPL